MRGSKRYEAYHPGHYGLLTRVSLGGTAGCYPRRNGSMAGVLAGSARAHSVSDDVVVVADVIVVVVVVVVVVVDII